MTESTLREISSTSDAGRVRFRTLFQRLWRYRDLLRELVRRDIEEAYIGSYLSRIWAILHPLLVLGIYTLIFGYIFVTRIKTEHSASSDYALFLMSGLVAWLSIQGALAKSASSLLASTNLVKQVAFPVELLPIKSVISGQLPLLVGLCVLTVYAGFRFGVITPLLPLVIYVFAGQLILLCGIGLLLAALTVFVRDTKDFVQFFLSFGIFILPIFYPPGTLPQIFEWLLYLNPFSYSIWCMQDIFFYGSIQHPLAWLALGFMSIASLYAGYYFFERTRTSFGDAL